MIDTSDGLSSDLGLICDASGVGARLFAEKIPTVVIPRKLARRGMDALGLALHGGEDYELLFTVPPSVAKRLPGNHRGVPLTVIGEITRQKAIVVTDSGGASRPLMPRGWDPFRMK
jgi:thiamine-monophosphate kinase